LKNIVFVASMAKQVFFDISTSMRWSGPPVGLVRVERELARWALKHDPNCRFVFFDADLQIYREVRQAHLPRLLEGSVSVDTTGMRDPSLTRPRKTDRVPRSLLPPFLWLTQSRRMALRTLGGWQLRSRSGAARHALSRVQDFVAGKKYRKILAASGGTRPVLAGLNVLAGGAIRFEHGDKILFAGANWIHSSSAYILEQKKHVAIDLITLCNDIIPLLSPQYFKPHDVKLLRHYFDLAFAISSLVLVTSKVVGDDVRKYTAEHKLPVGPIEQIPLGFDLPSKTAAPDVTGEPRRRGRHIILVSTIEPRKGHRLAQSVWSKLLQEGIPQQLDATLLMVGRSGWMVDDLLKTLSATDRISILENIDDQALADLYGTAEFCIYPSEYEGYGLPVVEALASGKAVLASNVGIVPELESPLLKKLPVNDEAAWYEAVKEWLAGSGPPRTSQRFRHPSWQEAAALTFAKVYDARPR
jgi:glycosyltransferase involved in cell wall biosynthesis